MFICETKKVKNTLEKLKKVLSCEGAYFHPNLKIYEKDGDFSIHCTPQIKREEKLISIPVYCLSSIEDFSVIEKDGEIIIDNYNNLLSETHKEIVRLQIELYNLTNKLTSHKKTSLFFAMIDNPESVEIILKGITMDKEILEQYKLWKKGEMQALAIKTFFKSRLFGLEDTHTNRKKQVLLPFIDFLNHHIKAKGYIQEKNTENNLLTVFNQQPIAGLNECFVSYNQFDAMSTFLNYGFVDEYVHFMFSVPVNLELGYGKSMEIRSIRNAKIKRTNAIPDALKDIASHLPGRLAFDKDKGVVLTHIIIPGEAVPTAMRRVLGLHIQSLLPMIHQNKKLEILKYAERQIITKNREYYKALEIIANESTTPEPFRILMKALVKKQLRWLDAYEQRMP